MAASAAMPPDGGNPPRRGGIGERSGPPLRRCLFGINAARRPRRRDDPGYDAHPGGDTAMATREQIEANRKNAQKSTGPRDTARTRFNGLKPGLRAEQVVLPGEAPAAFEAEKQA